MVNEDLYPPQRLTVAQRATAAAGLDALLITPSADLRYLTGYPARVTERLTCLVLPVDGEPTLIVPTLERPAAEAAVTKTLRIVDHPDGSDPYPLVAKALGGAGSVRSVGLANRMWAEQVLALRDTLPGVTQRLAGEVTAGLRMRKSPVAQAIRAAGHASADFTIVAAGPNGASPHHDVSDRVIQPGDPVVVDIGGTMPDGYCSDSTRTYVVGDPDKELLGAYEVLQAAQEAAVAAVRPGVTAEAVDAVARGLLTDAGYGEYFLHRTGHGIGLDGHEPPYLVTGNGLPLEPGMTFSVEPGFYIAGRHGARIEDIVACTADGVRRLNTISTDLVIL